MTRYTAPLITLLVLALSAPLAGCDSTAKLTEQEHIQRAKDFEDKGDTKAAIIEFKNALQKNPNSAQTRWLLGQLYVKAGMGDAAEKELLKARKLGVSEESILYPLGEALLQQQAFQRVLDEILVSPQFSSLNRARIERIRADALIGLGKIKEGCNLYNQSHQTDSQNIPAYWGLSACAWIAGDRSKSLDLLQEALKSDPRNGKTLRLIGQRHLDQGQIKTAIDDLNKSLRFAPNDVATHTQLGIAYLMLGNFTEAEKQTSQINNISPEHPDAAYLKAFALYLQKKPKEALPFIQQALKIGETLPAYMLLGSIQLDLGSLEQANKAFARALSAAPGNSFARKLKALTAIRMGKFDEALELITPLLKQTPPDSGALRLAGDIEMSKGHWQAAEKHYRQALGKEPGDTGLLTRLGQAEAQQGQTQEAIALFNQAAGQDGLKETDILIALTYLKARQYDKALATTSNLIRKLPQLPQGHMLAAQAYLGLNQRALAKERLQYALKLQPGFIPTIRMLSSLYKQDNQIEPAKSLWKNLLDRDKGNIEAMLALSDLARQSGQSAEADDWIKRAEKVAPNSATLAERVASQYLQSGEHAKAINTLQNALQSQPRNPALLSLIAQAQLAAGEPQNARTNFERALQLAPQDPRLLHGLALAEFGLSNFKASRILLDKLLKEHPQFYPAYDSATLLDMREGKPADAIAIAKSAQKQFPGMAAAYVLEGDILLAAKKWPEAAQVYRQAQTLTPSGQTLIKLHRAESRNGTLGRADPLLDQWLKAHPEDISVRLAKAELMLARLDLPKAEAEYRAILKLDPNRIQALNNLAFIVQGKDINQALGFAEKAYRLAPRQANVLDTLGWLLTTSGRDPKKGAEYLAKAVQLAPQAPIYRLHYAQALAKQNAKSQALQQLAPLVRLSGPLGDEARKLQATLH